VKNSQKGVFVYDGFNSNNYMEVLNKSEPFAQVDFHSTLHDLDIRDKDYQTYLIDWKPKVFPNRWEYLKFYNIDDIKIIISPIDNLIKMFFQLKVDILANFTLPTIAECMKFKLLYDDLVRMHLLKRSNQPVITSFHGYQTCNCIKKKSKKKEKDNNNNNYNNNNNINEFENIFDDESTDEDGNTNLFDKQRQKEQEEKEEEEITNNMDNLNIKPQVFLATLSPEQFLEVSHNCFQINKIYM
jgi:hypothetical protein